MKEKSLRVCFLHASFFCAVVLSAQPDFSQAPVSELSQRQLRFRAMEQRALELSQRLSKMSGTEPIVLIDRNESMEPVPVQSDAQQSYDTLPGPMVEPLALPKEEENEEKPTIFQSEVERVAPTNQQRKGDYYFMPFIGIAASSSVSLQYDTKGLPLSDKLDGDWGNAVGVSGGKRWDNWYAEVGISYQYQKFSTSNFDDNTPNSTIPANGVEESIILSIEGGYSVPITERLSHLGGAGLGFGWKKNSFDGDVYVLGSYKGPLDPKNESSLVFAYDFSLGLEYLFINNFSGYFGYKFLGLTKNKDFGSSFQHLIELGVGANF